MDYEITRNHFRLLELNEGFRGRPYRDTVGKLTIGYGRNLDANPLTPDEGAMLAIPNLKLAWEQLVTLDPWVRGLDEVRQAALVDLVYNLGIQGFMGFRRARLALLEGEFDVAAAHFADSRWYRQVKSRGPRICKMIRTGLWPWYTD